jgi:phenylacetate-CoA ligase
VGGRVTDFISTTNGRIVSGSSLTIYLIANAPGVAQAQLVQEDRGELVIRIYRAPEYSEASTEYLLETAKRFLGDTIEVTLEFLEEPIPVSASGKYHFSISNVDPFA